LSKSEGRRYSNTAMKHNKIAIQFGVISRRYEVLLCLKETYEA